MKRKNKIIFFCLILLGFIVRAGFLITPHMDADQAEFALQAMHIGEGEFEAFSWAYAYIGTLPAFLASVFFKIFGVSRLSFNGATFFLSFFFMWVVYATGKLLFSRGGAFVCLLLAVMAPFFQAFHCVWGRHGYLETLLFGGLVLYFTLYIIKQQDNRKKIKGAVFLGLFAGMGFWTNYLIIYYFPAAGLVLFLHDKKIFAKKYFYISCITFFVGSLPFWIFNFNNDFASFDMLLKPSVAALEFKDAVKVMVYDKMPKALGIVNVDGSPTNPAFSFVLASIYIAAFASLLLRVKGIFKFVFMGKKECFKPIDLFVLFLLSMCGIYLKTSYINFNTARYLLPVHSALPFVLTFMFMKLKGKKMKFIGLVMLMVMLNLNVYSNLSRWPFLTQRNYDNYKNDLKAKDQLLEFVKTYDIKTAQAFDYWTAPVVTFDLKEEFICALGYDRYVPYAQSLAGDLNRTYLLLDKNSTIENTFGLVGATYDYVQFGRYALYYNVKYNKNIYNVIPSFSWKVKYQYDMFNLGKINDYNVSTYGRTLSQQKRGDYFTVELDEVTTVAKVTLFLEKSHNDYPRAFKVEVSLDGKNWEKVSESNDYFCFYTAGLYTGTFPQGNILDIVFEPRDAKYLRITITENIHKKTCHAGWTVHEMFIYTPDGVYDFSDKDEIFGALEEYISAGTPVYASPYFMASLKDKGKYNPFDYTYYNKRSDKYLIDTSDDFVMCVSKGYVSYVKELLKKCSLGFEERKFLSYSLFAVKGGDVWNLKWEQYVPFFVYDKQKTMDLIEEGEKLFEKDHSAKAEKLYQDALMYKPCFYPGMKDLYDYYTETSQNDKADKMAKDIKDMFGNLDKKGTVFGKAVELVTLEYTTDSNLVGVKYVWRCLKEISKNLYVYVHFRDEDGNMLFQQDHLPTKGVNPVHFWVKGEIITERLTSVILPEHFGKKVYIHIGLWDPNGDKKKLKVTSSPYPHDGNTVIVGEFIAGEKKDAE